MADPIKDAADIVNAAWAVVDAARIPKEMLAATREAHFAAINQPQRTSMDKLTPRQNELISEALCVVACEQATEGNTPEILKTLRRALVSELEAVTAETTRDSLLRGVRSIDG